MANLLNVAILESIRSLFAQGWSRRRIALELGVDRETVGKYLRQGLGGPKPANAPTGSNGSKPATFPGVPALDPKPANAPTGSTDDTLLPPAADPDPAATPYNDVASADQVGPVSQCAPYRKRLQEQMDLGLSGRRIHQDLRADGIDVSYDSVRRFLRRLGRAPSLPFRRLECTAGQEAQVDFGTGAPVITSEGKRRKTYVFRVVLSHSRKGYSEATFTQTTEDFLRCLENTFAHLGGVPQTLVVDNLKAAVAHPDWFDPALTPKLQSFCQHYGTVVLPTKPYTPRHKGKIEAGVKYVKNNALKARTFANLEEENNFLAQWEATVADKRIHGTTKQQVQKVFAESERGALLPLPRERFASFHEAKRKVNRDGHVEVAKAYYSAPPEYLGREVWARWDARLVRLFNHRFEQIAIHVRREPGRFSTLGEHVAKEKISGVERGAGHLLGKVASIGTHTHQWAQAMLHARGIEGTRVLLGLLSLAKKHRSETLEKACETALSYGAFRLKTLRTLLQRQADQQQAPLPFLDEHPIIRPLDDYAAVVAQAIHRQADRPSVGEGFSRHGWTKASLGNTAGPGANHQGPLATDLLPPRSEYPSPGCASAEPGSVSPDASTIVPPSPFHQEQHDE
jgi:transposase